VLKLKTKERAHTGFSFAPVRDVMKKLFGARLRRLEAIAEEAKEVSQLPGG
jgi:hypothetical protein